MRKTADPTLQKNPPNPPTAPALTDIQVEMIGRETGEPGWMIDARKAAFGDYRHMNMPSPASEAWHRTDLLHFPFSGQNLEALTISGKTKKTPASWLKPAAGAQTGGQLVLEDRSVHTAVLDEDLSRVGVIFTPFSQAVRDHPDLVRRLIGSVVPSTTDIFSALTAVIFDIGFLLHVPQGVRIEKPLHSLLWSSAWRLLVNVEEGAQVSLIHELASPERDKAAVRLDTVELIVHRDASLRFCMTQAWSGNIVRIGHEKAVVHQDGRLNWSSVHLGAQIAKVFSSVDLQERGASVEWSGLQVLGGDQQADITTAQNHLAPNTISNLLNKGVLLGAAQSFSSGMVRVEADAAGTDGYQGNRILVLSDQAKAEAEPGLEILSDDVRCSHGVTIGGLDPEEIFYAQTRGIGEEESRKLLVTGFLDGILGRIPEEEIRQRVQLAVDVKMKTMEAGQNQKTDSARMQSALDGTGAIS
jgi:Fe-S cluster assembly protein SufD